MAPRKSATAAAKKTRPANGDGGKPGGGKAVIRTINPERSHWAIPGPAPEVPPEPAISLRGVSKRFGSHQVLEDISFDIPRGRITAIMGP